jgi:hypothetical protein
MVSSHFLLFLRKKVRKSAAKNMKEKDATAKSAPEP